MSSETPRLHSGKKRTNFTVVLRRSINPVTRQCPSFAPQGWIKFSECEWTDDVCVFSHQDTRLSVIASDHNYRQNFTAADTSRSTNMDTIHTIIDMIVCILHPPTQMHIKRHKHMNFNSYLFSFHLLGERDKGYGTFASCSNNETLRYMLALILHIQNGLFSFYLDYCVSISLTFI